MKEKKKLPKHIFERKKVQLKMVFVFTYLQIGRTERQISVNSQRCY